MNRTAVKVIRLGEEKEDFSWALKLSDDERIGVAERLLRDLWCMSHGQPFPTMDRSVVSLVRR